MTVRRLSVVLVAALVTVALVASGVALVSGGAEAAGAETTTSCTVVDDPGVYRLGANVTNASADSCVRVESDDVVLDGDGHALTGDGDGVAVEVTATDERGQDPYENVTVRDLRVDSWGTGLAFVNTENATVTGVAVADADVGVRAGNASQRRPGYVVSADGTTVTDSTVRDVGTGVVVEDSTRVAVVDSDVTGYGDEGVRLDGVSESAVARNELVASEGAGDAVVVAATFGQESHGDAVVANHVAGGDVAVDLEEDLVRGTSVVRNDVERGDVFVGGSHVDDSRTVVAANDVTDGAVVVDRAANVSVAGNTLTNASESGGPTTVRVEDSTRVAVRNNTVTGARIGVSLEFLALENTVADNRITGGGVGVEVRRSAVNNTVEGNTLAGNTDGVRVSLPDAFRAGTNVIRDNAVRNNTDGVDVLATSERLVVESNDLTGNENGVHVRKSEVCVDGAEGAELVEVHANAIAGNDEYGVLNEDADVLNATGNYWGADDGPSSSGNETLVDPVTGEPADGSGDAVSAGGGGESSVHFDPWAGNESDA